MLRGRVGPSRSVEKSGSVRQQTRSARLHIGSSCLEFVVCPVLTSQQCRVHAVMFSVIHVTETRFTARLPIDYPYRNAVPMKIIYRSELRRIIIGALCSHLRLECTAGI